MSLKKLYLRLFFLALILGPAFWLIFSEEGQRRTDVVLLKLFGGGAELNLAWQALHPQVDPEKLRTDLGQVAFQCTQRPTDFGDTACSADIAAVNGVPARYASFFFADRRLTAAKIGYQKRYHADTLAALSAALGAPVEEGGALRWRAGGGVVVAAEALGARDEPALFWLAAQPAPVPEAQP